ncbi:Uncharacterized protein APZ42_016398 [Daphnia magna]|uniref:CUB domain-containing protein n=1 Tax=Daphnia magna TaxID=35525 RepID=A0A165AEN6_9CRUS|nr:Uncharacterized protein APZ42_016398 [Daphnia magna]
MTYGDVQESISTVSTMAVGRPTTAMYVTDKITVEMAEMNNTVILYAKMDLNAVGSAYPTNSFAMANSIVSMAPMRTILAASYGNMCQQFTNSSGNFSSLIIPKPANEISSDRMSDIVRKTAVLISVEPNHQIWLTFEKCVTFENKHFVKIYDGPYSTSPLLLSRSGSLNPFSVRSSSNELYVEFPSYYDPTYGITAVYSTINATSEPFIPGCGGYIKGEGVISTPTYSANPDITDCFWFLETKNSEDTIVLSNSDFLSYQRMKSISATARTSEYDHYGRWQQPSPVSTVPPPAESPSLIANL